MSAVSCLSSFGGWRNYCWKVRYMFQEQHWEVEGHQVWRACLQGLIYNTCTSTSDNSPSHRLAISHVPGPQERVKYSRCGASLSGILIIKSQLKTGPLKLMVGKLANTSWYAFPSGQKWGTIIQMYSSCSNYYSWTCWSIRLTMWGLGLRCSLTVGSSVGQSSQREACSDNSAWRWLWALGQ